MSKKMSKASTAAQNIQEAAQRLFSANGYDSTTIADICNLAGVSKTTFYYHFKSKEDLSVIPLYHVPPTSESSNILLKKIIASDSAWKQIWLLSIDALTRCNHTYETASMKQVVAASLMSSQNFFSEIPDEHWHMMEPLIRKAQTNGEILNNSPAEQLVDHIYYAYIGVVIWWCTHPGGTRRDLFESMMCTMEIFLQVDSAYRFELEDF